MPSFRLRAKAKSNLKRIARVTEKPWGKAQRNEYLQEFDACFRQLSRNPLMGQDCHYIRAGCRKFPMKSHFVFYEVDGEDAVTIIRILHKHMDVSPSLFGG